MPEGEKHAQASSMLLLRHTWTYAPLMKLPVKMEASASELDPCHTISKADTFLRCAISCSGGNAPQRCGNYTTWQSALIEPPNQQPSARKQSSYLVVRSSEKECIKSGVCRKQTCLHHQQVS